MSKEMPFALDSYFPSHNSGGSQSDRAPSFSDDNVAVNTAYSYSLYSPPQPIIGSQGGIPLSTRKHSSSPTVRDLSSSPMSPLINPSSGIWGSPLAQFVEHDFYNSNQSQSLPDAKDWPEIQIGSWGMKSSGRESSYFAINSNPLFFKKMKNGQESHFDNSTPPISIPKNSLQRETNYNTKQSNLQDGPMQDSEYGIFGMTDLDISNYQSFPKDSSFPIDTTVYRPTKEEQDEFEFDFDDLMISNHSQNELPPAIPLPKRTRRELSVSNPVKKESHDMMYTSLGDDISPITPSKYALKIKKKKKSGSKNELLKGNSPRQVSPMKDKQLCLFNMEGNCRYGANCRNVHGELCNVCNKPLLVPRDQEQNEAHKSECTEKKITQEEIEYSKRCVCENCKQNVVDNNKRFGILTECSHCFCLQCIKDWRSETQSAECPVCYVISYFVVPSNVMVIGEARKAKLILNYKSKMKQIPCKYYDGGKGTCKFGANCHYAHSGDLTVQDSASPNSQVKGRTLTGSDGSSVSVNDINLGMFLNNNKEQETPKFQIKR